MGKMWWYIASHMVFKIVFMEGMLFCIYLPFLHIPVQLNATKMIEGHVYHCKFYYFKMYISGIESGVYMICLS